VRRLIALALLAGIVVPASSALAASSGGIGVRLVDSGVPSQVDPRARSYIIERLAPGATIRRRVEISNSTGLTEYVSVYPAASHLRRGGFGFAPGHSRNDLSSWTSMSRAVLRLAPGTNAFETVTIRVPKDASVGQRYAVVWAEVSNRSPAAGGVTLVNRVGVRMYVSIGLGGAPRSNFEIGSLVATRSATGVPLVLASLHNNGGRTLDVTGYLALTKGPGGLRAGPFPVELAAGLAPGAFEPMTVRLDKRLPRGPWHAALRLRNGFLVRTAGATITFPPKASPVKARSVVPAGARLILVILMFLVVLLAVIALALVLFRRSALTGRRER
jgi:hypothetical protein